MSDSLRPSAKLQENRAMTRKIKKGQRTGRDPETGTDVPNSLCRVIVFTPSVILKQRINGHGRRGVA
jgi:nucleoid DNA-binding protein